MAQLTRVDDIAMREAFGEMVTLGGRVLDPSDFSLKRNLQIDAFKLTNCQRQDLKAVMCAFRDDEPGVAPAVIRLDADSGAFLGAYRPKITQKTNGCPTLAIDVSSFGLDGMRTQPAGSGRLLVSAMPFGDGAMCTLQAWQLRGVAPS